MRRSFLLLLVLVAAPARAAASSPSSCPHALAASRSFLTAFENLDWARFRKSFADDATVFFPTPEPPRRFFGRAEYEAQFKRVFSAIRAASKSDRPPFHRLPPADLRCEPLGRDAALVSFTLVNSERTGRRTIIWRRQDGRWRIIHLHASNALK